MDLTFQVPTQHCSLQHQISPLSLDTPTTEHRFCFGRAPSFFLELLVVLLHSSPGAHRTPPDPGAHLLVSNLFVLLYIHEFLMASALGGLLFPAPVDREARRAAAHGVAKSWTWLGDWTATTATGWIKNNSCAVAVLWPFILVYLKELKKK